MHMLILLQGYHEGNINYCADGLDIPSICQYMTIEGAPSQAEACDVSKAALKAGAAEKFQLES